MFAPPRREGIRAFGADGDYFGVAHYKFLIILAQLRHVPAAVGSKKTAVKNQNYIFDTFITGESELPSFAVRKFKIGCGLVLGDFAVVHENLPPLREIKIRRNIKSRLYLE
jgi:hypothetical protein